MPEPANGIRRNPAHGMLGGYFPGFLHVEWAIRTQQNPPARDTINSEPARSMRNPR